MVDIVTTTTDGNTDTIMNGSFTFEDNNKFRDILQLIDSGATRSLAVNVKGLESVDSAALGMLMMLRKKCQDKQIPLVIKHPQGQIKKMFELSKFYELFQIID